MGNYTSRPKLADKEPFERLFSLAEVANMSDAEYRKYSRSLKQYWDTCATEDTDNWRYERGVKHGEKIGEMRGEKRGVKIGEKQGVLKEKISNSLKMFLKGFDRETVIDTLELTDDEIKLFDEAIEQTK